MDFEKDRALTLFSSDGKLEQCDNALQAAIKGSLSVSANATDGIVLASLKHFSPLVDKSRVNKIVKICDTIGMTYSGLQPDFRIIYDKACKLVEDYKDVYGVYPHVDVFVSYLSRILQEYTQKGGLRPFGVMILICGPMLKKSEEYDCIKANETICGLFRMDPSGSFQSIKCGAIGKDYRNAVKYIENRLELLDDNLVSCILSLKECAGSKVEPNDVDVGIYKLESNEFIVYSSEYVKELFDSISS